MDTSDEIAASKDTSKVDSSSVQIADVVTTKVVEYCYSVSFIDILGLLTISLRFDAGGSIKNKPVGHKLKLNLKAAKEATKKTVDLKPNPKTPDKPKSKEVDSVKSE
ncbi:hypothetical protein Tco_1576451 [Tanacetum coccineum]